MQKYKDMGTSNMRSRMREHKDILKYLIWMQIGCFFGIGKFAFSSVIKLQKKFI